MAVNLVSLIMQFITPKPGIENGRRAAGLDRDQAQKAVGVSIPAILAGSCKRWLRNRRTSRQLSDVMAQQSTALDQAKSAINDGRAQALAETEITFVVVARRRYAQHAGWVRSDVLPGLIRSTAEVAVSACWRRWSAGVIGQQQRERRPQCQRSRQSFDLAVQPGHVGDACRLCRVCLAVPACTDGLGDSWRSGAAAASATANLVSDMAGQAAASAGNWRRRAKAHRPATGPGSWRPWQCWRVSAGMFSVMTRASAVAERPLSPTTRPSETTGAGVPDQRLTDLAAELTSSVSATRSALQGISDPVSHEAALPKLQQASTQFDNISNAISLLPPNARKECVIGGDAFDADAQSAVRSRAGLAADGRADQAGRSIPCTNQRADGFLSVSVLRDKQLRSGAMSVP